MKKKFLFALIWAGVLCLLAGMAQAMTVTLAWDPNSEPDLAGYNVYYSTDPLIPAANRTKVNVALTATGFIKASPQWVILGLSDTVRLYFCVTAYDNEIPSLESGYSNILNAAYVDIFKGKAPAIPGGLRIAQVVTTVSTTTVTNKVAMMK